MTATDVPYLCQAKPKRKENSGHILRETDKSICRSERPRFRMAETRRDQKSKEVKGSEKSGDKRRQSADCL
ncbi:hypothetical protein RUM44_000691 [Polyplax serrata]|uniref:Uncharacterized protein n=1 Tax=Polyplax serrata TaxID=468196 RepID=A0ABR1B620_POLSC